jgi:TonB family protein
MGAREQSVHTLPHPEACPCLCIERLQISSASGHAADHRDILVAVALSECGRASLVGAVLLTGSLHEGWQSLLNQLSDRGQEVPRLVVSSAPSELQAETLRAYPRARWQLPPGAFYERVLQHVPLDLRERVRHQLRSIHDQPDFIAAEHTAAAALDTLTHSGLWDAAITLAATYQDTLMFYSLPGGASLPIFKGDAIDRLLDDFLRDIAATDQFRDCSITRSDLHTNAGSAAEVDRAPAEREPRTPATPEPETIPATVSGRDRVHIASPMPSASRVPRNAGEGESSDLIILDEAPSAPIPDNGPESLADVEELQPFGLPYTEDDARSSPVPTIPLAIEAARGEPPSGSGKPAREPPEPPRASFSSTPAVDAGVPAKSRASAPPALTTPAGGTPSESLIVAPRVVIPTSAQPTPPDTVDGLGDSATVVALQSGARRPERVRSKALRYAAAGLTAVAVNVVLVGMVLGLLETDKRGSPAEIASQFVRIVEFSPEDVPMYLRGGTHRNSSAPSSGGRRAIDMEPKLMALAIPDKPMDLPPLELTPIPALRRIEVPAPPKRVETISPPAAVTADVGPPASTQPDDGQAPGAGAGSGAGHGAGMRDGGGAREAEEGNSAPVYREPPEYPRAALLAGIEGVVTLEFAISEGGTVRDPHVVEAVPAGVFDAAALKAIARWRYSPRSTARHARQSILFSLKR